MDQMVFIGVLCTGLGIIGLMYCVFKAYTAKKKGLIGPALTAQLKRLVVINLVSLFLSAIGLALVIIGILL